MDPFDRVGQAKEDLELTGVLRDCLVGGIIAVDPDRRICALNPEAERLTGLRADGAIGQQSQLLPRRLHDLIEQTFASQAGLADQVDLPQSDGSSFVVRVATNLCAGPNGQLGSLIVVLNDLAAVQKLAANMQRLDRLASIGTLSASMAHEIKNALVAIKTFLQDLVQRNKDSELAGIVTREFHRVDTIVSQMLKFAGPSKPTFSRLSLHRILDQSLRLIQPQLETKQIRMRRSFSARPDRVEGDDYQLEQAFLNILLNAVAATEPAGLLSVSTEVLPPAAPAASEVAPSPPWLQVTIADTGAGISPENLPHLFEPFFSTKAGGTGLGLAITRRIILEHHGRVEVESELKNGTTFKISFPLLDSGRPA
ncbi:MAG: ATP-binding protein [Verrucomicrobiota bacterium]